MWNQEGLGNGLLTNEQLPGWKDIPLNSRPIWNRGAPRSHLIAAINEAPTWTIRLGKFQFSLNRSSWRHILGRHHPAYWDGSWKVNQTFFSRSMGVYEIEQTLNYGLKHNRAELLRIGDGVGRFRFTANQIEYQIGISYGRISQFFPTRTRIPHD
jgi:hypothetical protein